MCVLGVIKKLISLRISLRNIDFYVAPFSVNYLYTLTSPPFTIYQLQTYTSTKKLTNKEARQEKCGEQKPSHNTTEFHVA